LLHWFFGGLFLCLAPFLWGKVSGLSASPLLSVCCDTLLIVFQFCKVGWLCMLLTVSGDELCGPLPALFQAAAYHQPAVGPSAFPACVYWKFTWRSPPCHFLFPRALPATPSLFCVLVFISLLNVQDFGFFRRVNSVCSGRVCWLIPGMAGGIPCDAWCSPVGLPNVSQAGLKPASSGAAALLFSQYNVVWRSFLWARGSGCQSFDSSWCFISAKCGSNVSEKFWSLRAHTVCFCALIAILDLLSVLSFK
jgi:hypothetical protein